MSDTLDALTAQVLALPPDQRFKLAHRLWASVEGEIDDDEELFAEIARRDAEVESGAVKPIPFDQALQQIRDSLQ